MAEQSQGDGRANPGERGVAWVVHEAADERTRNIQGSWCRWKNAGEWAITQWALVHP